MPQPVYGNVPCTNTVTSSSSPQFTAPKEYTDKITVILQRLNATRDRKGALTSLNLLVEDLVLKQGRSDGNK